MQSIKQTIFAFAASAPLFAAAQSPSTNLYATVTNLWWQGRKAEAMALGQARLNVDSNDMPGLIIKQEYDGEFLALTTLSNSLTRVIAVGATITNSNFNMCYPWLKICNEHSLNLLSVYKPSAAELVEERAKGLIPKKIFTLYEELEALHKDGLFEPLP